MRPRRTRVVNRLMVAASLGALIAAGGIVQARAETVVTGEGIFMPRGSTSQQFGGAFCKTNQCVTVSSMPTSVRSQAAKLDAAVMNTTGPTVLWGFSLSAAAVHRVVNDWVADPDTAPDPERVRVITTGNPYNRYGGTDRNQPSAVPLPASPYQHLDVVNAYDSVADKPARWGWYSQLELSLSRHLSYADIDIDAPENLVTADGSYMLVPAKELRQLRWIKPWVSEERYAELDAERRQRIEADYDRPELHEQGPGADWGNGIEPQSLREEDDERTQLRDDAERERLSLELRGRAAGDGGADAPKEAEDRRELGVDNESDDGGAREDRDQRQDRLAVSASGSVGVGADGGAE